MCGAAHGDGACCRDKRLAYLLLGSHNLSRAAWGVLQHEGARLYIQHYELGVLLLPSLEQVILLAERLIDKSGRRNIRVSGVTSVCWGCSATGSTATLPSHARLAPGRRRRRLWRRPSASGHQALCLLLMQVSTLLPLVSNN